MPDLRTSSPASQRVGRGCCSPGHHARLNSSSRLCRFKRSSLSHQEAAGDAGNCSCSGMLGRTTLTPTQVTSPKDTQKSACKCPCPGRHMPGHVCSWPLQVLPMHSRPFAPPAEGPWIFTTRVSTDTTQGLWGWKEGLGLPSPSLPLPDPSAPSPCGRVCTGEQMCELHGGEASSLAALCVPVCGCKKNRM